MKKNLLVLVVALCACDCDDDESPADDGGTSLDGSDDMDGGNSGLDASAGTDGAVGSDSSADGATAIDGGFTLGDGGIVLCGTEPCECANGIDDDGDGDVDGLDGECTGPLDNDEGTFGTGIPGDNRDPNCQDCFFDGNSGSGDDRCRYATSCLVDGTPTSGSGSCMTCDATADCVNNCRPLTPNGCDCFGCCEVAREGAASVFVILGATCSEELLNDETACPRCMQADDCVNECGRCELCPGKTLADLPDDCSAMPTCEDGEQVCSASSPCPTGFSCQLGCCLPTLI